MESIFGSDRESKCTTKQLTPQLFKMHLLLVIMLSYLSHTASARFNEFEILASTFDDLSLHNKNCTSQLDTDVVLMYCEDGYFAIDSIESFFLTKQQNWKQANSTLDILDAPKDVRLDKFITLVDASG